MTQRQIAPRSRPIVIVAGPTCSGKSALAAALAERHRGVVINADAMQTYAELRILTARPSAADEARVPHALYGVRAAADPSTAAWWRRAALEAMAATDRLPILCGGTFLYLDALLHGLANIPDPGAAARGEARSLLAAIGAPALHARLAAADPATAARLNPHDGQRLARAWEVLRGTGRGLASWQTDGARGDAGQGPGPLAVRLIQLDPERAVLRAAIAERWHAMLEAGALQEVRALRALALDPALPLLRAHGVAELGAVLDGAMSLAEAGLRAVLAIGRYTKRQATWLRHRPIAEKAQTFHINARWTATKHDSLPDMAALSEFVSLAG